MKNFLDENNIEKKKKKLETYKRLESENFDEILSVLDEMNDCYDTKNTDNLAELKVDFNNKFNDRDNYTQTNIFVYRKNLETYRELANETVETLEDTVQTIKKG